MGNCTLSFDPLFLTIICRNVDQVSDLMDDIVEQIDTSRAIGGILSEPFDTFDEVDLENELNELEQELHDELDCKDCMKLPSPPVISPVKPPVRNNVTEEERELQELERAMAL